ncbi:hypothetical protein LTR12_008759 [Friedmanniomyces endolithicus]|nr:hypothetical protein LTR74_004506 [Friedmanniomyces endolithicus]KAK1816817.1 hypothetical protein LTR12_008759 [Friedmanniomyces endolithicus]
MASSVISSDANDYGQAEINAAEALLELSQPVRHAQESLTSAARALLALGQPLHHAQQRLSSTASTPSSRTHHHDANASSRAAVSLPLYSPPIPFRHQNQDHQAAETVFAFDPTPPRPHSYDQEDYRAAEALLALNREDSKAAETSLFFNPTRPRPNPHNQANFQAAEVLLGREPRDASESVDGEGWQVGPRRVEAVVDRYMGVRWAEGSERRDSANDGALAAGRVGARGLGSDGDRQEENGRDERSLWSE